MLLALELRHDLNEVLETGPEFKEEEKEGVEGEVNCSLLPWTPLSGSGTLPLIPTPSMGSVLL